MKKCAFAYLCSGILFVVLAIVLDSELALLYPVADIHNAVGFIQPGVAIFVCSLLAAVCFLTSGILAIQAITKEA